MSNEKKDKPSEGKGAAITGENPSENIFLANARIPLSFTIGADGKLIENDSLPYFLPGNFDVNPFNAVVVGNANRTLGFGGYFGSEVKSTQQIELESELAKQRAEIAKLRREKKNEIEARKKIEKEQETQGKLIILNRISNDAHAAVLASQELQDKFLKEAGLHDCFIMSIDIRRSTELMLQASSEIAFKNFIRQLTKELKQIVLQYDGVFDKFTGDGILAFFPEFFTGADAGVKAIAAAEACHETFNLIYKHSEASFDVVPTDVGLGIGIDYGKTQIVKIEDSLTVVGKPVVYACRLGAAPAGATLLNPNAYRAVCAHSSTTCNFTQVALEIKRDKIKAYAAKLSSPPYKKQPPGWIDFLPKPPKKVKPPRKKTARRK